MSPRSAARAAALGVALGGIGVLSVAGVARPLAAQAAATSAAFPVRVGASRVPDTVRVGDPFRVLLRVAAPAGARVDFPASADSAAPVEVTGGPRQRSAAAPGGGVDVTAEYTVAAWTTGTVPVALDSVTVRVGAGASAAVRRVAMPPLAVVVRSVLPADTALRVPKPPREPLPDLGLWWLRYALVALGLLALVAALLLLARRRHGRGRAGVGVGADDPYARALAGFDALDRRGLVALGEGGRHVAIAVDLARDYLVARFGPAADASQTGGELLAALADQPDVPRAELGEVLAAGDLVKFAAVPVAPADAGRVSSAARGVVESTEAARRAREAREAAEAAERARVAEQERRAYEAARRRAGRDADRDAGREDRAA